MTYCELQNNIFTQSNKTTNKTVPITDGYRIIFNRIASNMINHYSEISAMECEDVPEIFYDKSRGVCFALFFGDERDVEVLEEYLKSRPC